MKKILTSKRFSITLGFLWFWIFFCLWLIISNKLFTNFNFNIQWVLIVFTIAISINILIPFLIRNENDFKNKALLFCDINMNLGGLLSANLCLNNPTINTVFWFAGFCTYYGCMIGSFKISRLLISKFFYTSLFLLNSFYITNHIFTELDYLFFSMAFIFSVFTTPISALFKNLKVKLSKNKKVLESEKTKIQRLLNNLGQGFMVLDKKGIIQEGATEITKSFFNIDPIGKPLPEVLKLPEERKESFDKWLKNIWRGSLAFQDLKILGPRSFELMDRYIELDYKPIYIDDSKRKIDKVITIASDKTHEFKLKKQLEKDKENTEFINKCLQNPLEFVDLIFDSTALIQEYDFESKEDKSKNFRKFHTLKARFGQFSLKSITSSINDIETAISEENFEEVQSSIESFDLTLKDFVKKNRLIVEAANKFLVDEGNAVQVPEIIRKAKEIGDIEKYIDFVKKEYLLSDIKTKFERYIPLANEIAERQGKSINFQIYGDKVLVDTNRYSNFINTAIHLFRNIVDHGIEPEDDRTKKNKPNKGNIKLNFKLIGEKFEIHLNDDGQGIDLKKIKEKAIEKGLISDKDLLRIKDENIMDLIFLPGLSTKEEITEVSGRGIGMDAVREEIEKLGGKISVSSKINEGTTFVIQLPVLS